MFFSKYTIAATALASGTIAKTIPIKVGDGGLTFSPNSTTAAVGDILEFSFYAKNHTVTQGSFATPCEVGAVTDAFYSGFMPTSSQSNMTFSVNVTSTTPLWVFCSQSVGTHCQKGMAMVVNEVASSGKTLDAYVKAAAGTTKSEIPAKVQGGTFAASSSSSGSSGTGTSSTSSGSKTSSTSASTSTSAAGSVVVSPLNLVVAGAAAVGAFAFSVAL